VIFIRWECIYPHGWNHAIKNQRNKFILYIILSHETLTRVWASSKLWLPNAIERGNMGTRGADKGCERDGLYAVCCERLYCRVNCFNFMFCWPCISIHPRNENQLDALFVLSLFRQSTSTCFGHICSPSLGGIYNNWYVLCFSVDCLLARPADGFHYTDCRVSKTFWSATRIRPGA